MEPYLEYGYRKMYKKRKKTLVAYWAKREKAIKTSTGQKYYPRP
jgi:hypothetical protein